METPDSKETGALRLTHDAFGRLVLSLPGGARHEGVVPVRGFPYSAPDHWISFLDEQGRETYCLPSAADLDAEIRNVLEAELALHEFIPTISGIESVSSGAEPTEWHVVTDRGATRFVLTSEDHIRRLEPDGALIVDAHGIRYRIRDLNGLDAHSRRILRRYL